MADSVLVVQGSNQLITVPSAPVTNVIATPGAQGPPGPGLAPPALIAGVSDAVQLTIKGFTTQTAVLQDWRTSANVVKASISNAGTFNAQAFQVAGTALASTHLSDTAALARLAAPTFTGVPAAPTAAVDTTTTQLATTAFVINQAGSATSPMDGVAAVGVSKRYARQDHVHPVDTSRAALASPTFTGVPAGPTAAVDTNTTQLATTAYVVGQGYLKTSTKVFYSTHTWAIGKEIKVAAGDTDYIPPAFIQVRAGNSVKLVKCIARINSGTSVTLKLQDTGVDIAGFTGITVTTTTATTDPVDVALADGDVLAPVVTAVAGTPMNMTLTVVLEHTV